MDFTWSQGQDKRLKARQSTPKKAKKSDTLPSIDVGSPTSSAGGRTLQTSVSEPWISFSAGQPRRQTARERIKAFTERNNPMTTETPNDRFDGRRNFAKLQREIVEANKAHDDAKFLGAKGVDGFKWYLMTRFGSVVAGWRELDLDRNGRLTYYEFINACRRMGYHGNLKKLWSELDANRNGSISLMEIDAECGHYVGTFKLALIKKYGDILTAWHKGLDTNKTGRIEQKEIDDACARLGLGLDTKKLFGMLTVGPTSLGMTLQDFDPEAYNRWLSGDLKGLASTQADTEFLDDIEGAEDLPEEATRAGIQGGAKKFRQEVITRDQADMKAERDRDAKFRCGLHTAAGFKQALVNRFGSLYTAWREVLDLDGNARISFSEFSLALQRLGFHGNIKGLWAELDYNKSGHVLFADLDASTDALVKELKTKLVAEYGNILLGWLKGLDTRSTGMVNEQQFTKACSKLGFSGDAQQLFRILQPDMHRNFLTVQDFDTRAYLALSRGDFRMISEPEETRKPADKRSSELSFFERQDGCFNYQIQRAWQVAKREEFAKACRVPIPGHLADTTEAFEFLCKRNYGSLIGAWRFCLDFDGNGKLTFGEFCKALRRLGYLGDYQALFKKYLKDGRQFVTLKDLDPEADELITSFLELFGKEFGELERGWRLGFKKDPHDSIDEAGLKEACDKLGYPHDAGKLFKCLQPMPGRQLLTIWDLDPNCTRKRQRGDPAFISTAKDAESKTGTRTHFSSKDELNKTSPSRLNTTGMSSVIEAQIPQLEILRRTLRNKYGSTVVAWRLALDPDSVGTTAFGRLCLVLDECAFKGNRKAIWQELLSKQPQKRTHIEFQDIDADAQAMLDSARTLILGLFSSISEFWRKGLDPENIGRLGEEEFLQSWAAFGFEHKWSAKKLFMMLLARPFHRAMVQEDLRSLLIGVPPPEHPAMWEGTSKAAASGSPKAKKTPAGDAPADASPTTSPRTRSASPSAPASPAQAGRSPSSPSRSSPPRSPSPLRETGSDFNKSLTLPWSPKAAKQYDLKFPALDISHTTQQHHEQDVIVNNLANFKRMLRTKYGSIFSAWNHLLDADHNGVVTLRDFADACRTLGVKAAQKIWLELDADVKGQVGLKDLDYETWDAYTSLDQLVQEKFESPEAAWKEVFDPDRKISCDEANFVAGCGKLGLQHDAARLFKLLRPEAGRPALFIEDIWVDAKRGKATKPTSPTSPKSQASPASPKPPASPASPKPPASPASPKSPK